MTDGRGGPSCAGHSRNVYWRETRRESTVAVVLIDDLSLVNIVCGVVDFAFRLL